MSRELLQLLERHRELAAAGEMVDTFLGTQLDRRVRHNLARATADGYRAEGASFAERLATAKLRLALMDKYGDGWSECPEWKATPDGQAHERAATTRPKTKTTCETVRPDRDSY